MSYVLIVDDQTQVQTLVGRILEPLGRELRTASNAKDALAAIVFAAPDVVVCDVHMPGRDGLWLAERVRELCPTTAIVLATADREVPPFESLRKGVVAYVLKPFRADQLRGAVEEGLQWSAAEAQKRGTA